MIVIDRLSVIRRVTGVWRSEGLSHLPDSCSRDVWRSESFSRVMFQGYFEFELFSKDDQMPDLCYPGGTGMIECRIHIDGVVGWLEVGLMLMIEWSIHVPGVVGCQCRTDDDWMIEWAIHDSGMTGCRIHFQSFHFPGIIGCPIHVPEVFRDLSYSPGLIGCPIYVNGVIGCRTHVDMIDGVMGWLDVGLMLMVWSNARFMFQWWLDVGFMFHEWLNIGFMFQGWSDVGLILLWWLGVGLMLWPICQYTFITSKRFVTPPGQFNSNRFYVFERPIRSWDERQPVTPKQ